MNDDPFKLTDEDDRILTAASIAMNGIPDALSLMNALCQWDDPPPSDERWERKIAAACEIAVAFCRQAQRYKRRLEEAESKSRND